jgi:hypothetical protein
MRVGQWHPLLRRASLSGRGKLMSNSREKKWSQSRKEVSK